MFTFMIYHVCMFMFKQDDIWGSRVRSKDYVELRWGRCPWDPIIRCLITSLDTVMNKDVNLVDPDLGEYKNSFRGVSLKIGVKIVYMNEFAKFIFDLGKQKVGTYPKMRKTKHMENCPMRKYLKEEFMK